MKVAFLTLGCKVNFYETEKMEADFEANHVTVVPFKEKADVYIVNTCTVTNIADRKSRQMLHRARRLNPESIVVATGCYAESGKAQLEDDDTIDVVFANRDKASIASQVLDYVKEHRPSWKVEENGNDDTGSRENVHESSPVEERTSAKSVVQLIWEKAKGFIQKAFTIIFLASIIIWFLQTFDIRLNVAESADESLLAMIGSLAAPLFKPLGFGDWRISTALITGFTAKESVVSTLTVLLGGDVSQIHTLFTPFTAFVFLVFTLLYTPCVAAVATVKREMGSNKAAFLTVVAQCVIAWVAAFAVHALGFLF